jgi:glutamine amidotransferase
VSPAIAVVDCGAGNLASVLRGLAAAGGAPRVARTPVDIAGAGGVVIPGVGHYGATTSLGREWRRAVRAHVEAGRPLLGICLGMQWLFEGSEEAPDVPGLGLLRGRAVRLGGPVKVPHVGWNRLTRNGPSALLGDGADRPWVYFTHAYAVPPDADAVVASAAHGRTFAAVVERGRVFGTQYHPEKSGVAGLGQLRRFVETARAG